MSINASTAFDYRQRLKEMSVRFWNRICALALVITVMSAPVTVHAQGVARAASQPLVSSSANAVVGTPTPASTTDLVPTYTVLQH